MPSDLSTAIIEEQWDRCISICQTQPNTAKSWTNRLGLFEGIKDSKVLPIHEALVAEAPFNVIEALLYAYPDSVYCKESSYQRLPLHCACRKNARLDVVDLLCQQYPDAALTADSLGRLPRELYISSVMVQFCLRNVCCSVPPNVQCRWYLAAVGQCVCVCVCVCFVGDKRRPPGS